MRALTTEACLLRSRLSPLRVVKSTPNSCPLAGPGVGHTSTVWELAFDAEGRRMVSCSDDGTLKVWACRKDAGTVVGCAGCRVGRGAPGMAWEEAAAVAAVLHVVTAA